MSLQVRHLGGAFARSRPTNGAVDAVEQPFVLVGVGVPAAPGLAEAITATYRRLDDELGQHTDGRTVPNFLSAGEDVDRVWSPETRARLATIKRAVDPSSIIRSNRPVLRSEERRIVG